MGRRRDHGQCPAEVILHLRRLDALLKNHGLHHTAHTLEMEAGLFFEAAHLEQLVRQGLWASAHRYLRCFSALWGDADGDGAATKYTTLLSSLSHHSILAWLACRGDEGGRAASFLRPSDEAIRKACPEEARRKDMYCSMTSQQARASVNWDDIKLETLARVQELVDLRPNLDRMLKNRLPRHKPTPQDVIPLGGSWRYRRKRVGHKPARDLAYFVLHKRLPSSHKIKQSVVKYPDRKSLLYTPKWSAKLNSGKDTKWPRTTVEFDEQQKENDFTRSDEISKKEAQDQCWI